MRLLICFCVVCMWTVNGVEGCIIRTTNNHHTNVNAMKMNYHSISTSICKAYKKVFNKEKWTFPTNFFLFPSILPLCVPPRKKNPLVTRIFSICLVISCGNSSIHICTSLNIQLEPYTVCITHCFNGFASLSINPFQVFNATAKSKSPPSKRLVKLYTSTTQHSSSLLQVDTSWIVKGKKLRWAFTLDFNHFSPEFGRIDHNSSIVLFILQYIFF